jgi:hypothetical protein
MKYKILFVARDYTATAMAIGMSIAELDTAAEATQCLKNFDGNSVIGAFAINFDERSIRAPKSEGAGTDDYAIA